MIGDWSPYETVFFDPAARWTRVMASTLLGSLVRLGLAAAQAKFSQNLITVLSDRGHGFKARLYIA